MPGIGKLIVVTVLIALAAGGAVVYFAFQRAPQVGRGFDASDLMWQGILWSVLPILAAIAIIFIVVMVFVRRFTKGFNRDLLGHAWLGGRGGAGRVGGGLPASGLVTSLRDTGVTLNNINAVLEVGLQVTLPGEAPYNIATRATVGRHQLGMLQPGVTVAVRVDPNDRNRVAIDLSGGIAPAGGMGGMGGAMGGGAGVVHTPGGAFNVPGLTGQAQASEVLSTDDILEQGEPGEAEIRAATHTGATASQMVPGARLRAGESDDPMVHIVMMVTPQSGAPFQTQAIVRVPDGMLSRLTIGQKVPVACLPDQQTAAIDWRALRYRH